MSLARTAVDKEANMKNIILACISIILICALSSCYIPITNENSESTSENTHPDRASVEVYYIDITNINLPASYCLELGETFFIHVKANGYGEPVAERDFVVYAEGDSDCFDIQYTGTENGKYIYKVVCVKEGSATIYAEATLRNNITSRLIITSMASYDDEEYYHIDKSSRTYHKKDCSKLALISLDDREWAFYELNDAYYHPCEQCIDK